LQTGSLSDPRTDTWAIITAASLLKHRLLIKFKYSRKPHHFCEVKRADRVPVTLVIGPSNARLSAPVYCLKKPASGFLKFPTNQIAVATALEFAGTMADAGAACSPRCNKLWKGSIRFSTTRTGYSPRLDARFAIWANALLTATEAGTKVMGTARSDEQGAGIK
jgi:hypothetical protein